MKKEYNSPVVRVVLLHPITLLAGSETIPVQFGPRKKQKNNILMKTF